MRFEAGNRAAKGGSRPGAGRKLSPAKALKKLEQAQRIMAAEEAFVFELDLMRDLKASASVRVACAQDIQDRVFGRAKQGLEHSGQIGPTTIRIVNQIMGDEKEKAAQ